MTKIEEVLNNRKQIRLEEWKANEIEVLNTLQLLTAKPVVYVVNMSEKDYFKKGSKWLMKIKQWADAHGAEPMVPFCVAFETKLLELGDEGAKKYCEEVKATSGLSKIIRTGYHTLDLVHFFYLWIR